MSRFKKSARRKSDTHEMYVVRWELNSNREPLPTEIVTVATGCIFTVKVVVDSYLYQHFCYFVVRTSCAKTGLLFGLRGVWKGKNVQWTHVCRLKELQKARQLRDFLRLDPFSG